MLFTFLFIFRLTSDQSSHSINIMSFLIIQHFKRSLSSNLIISSIKTPCALGSKRLFASEDEKIVKKQAAEISAEGKKSALIRKELKKKYEKNLPQLMEFFDEIENWGAQSVRSGRPWTKEELRIKSNSDLHKLWFVLYKERNMLLSMEDAAKTEVDLFPSPERKEKVEESMVNLEDVVRERNKAYYELEVGQGLSGDRPTVFRRDQFGRHRVMGCSEHLIPYWKNNEYRKLQAPGSGKIVIDFIRKLREKKITQLKSKIFRESQEVRQILRRFPDTDLEYLQEKYPRVPVEAMRESLEDHEERFYISPGTEYDPHKKLMREE